MRRYFWHGASLRGDNIDRGIRLMDAELRGMVEEIETVKSEILRMLLLRQANAEAGYSDGMDDNEKAASAEYHATLIDLNERMGMIAHTLQVSREKIADYEQKWQRRGHEL